MSIHQLNHLTNDIKISAMEIKRRKPQDGIAPNSPSHIISTLSMPGEQNWTRGQMCIYLHKIKNSKLLFLGKLQEAVS